MFSIPELIITAFAILFFGILIRLVFLVKNNVLYLNIITLLTGLFCVVAGIMLLFTYSAKLKAGLEEQKWPSVQGEILRTEIAGKRAFRPKIEYQYRVYGLKYKGTSDYRVAGFGGRINRLDAAEKLAKSLPPGKKIRVYYNPVDVEESLLRSGVSYTIYLAATCGVILYFGGLILLIFSLIPKIEFSND